MTFSKLASTFPKLLLAGVCCLGCGDDGGDGGSTVDAAVTGDSGSTIDAMGNTGGMGLLTATSTYDGAALTFSCGPEFKASEGNIKSYTSSIDVYVLQCRSMDGSTQVKLGVGAPAVGTTTYTVDGGISLGGINEIVPLGAASANVVTNSVTYEEVTMGTHLKGTFTAEWDATGGGKVGTITGAFDVDF